MKIVFATGIFPPDIGGPANSVSMLAADWSARGRRAAVVTYSDIADDGVARPYEVVRILRAQPVWKRYAAFLRALWRASDQPGPIFAQDGVASGLPALIVARARRRRLILRIAGDFAWEHAQVDRGYRDSLEAFQKDRNLPPGIKLMRALQRFVYRRADRVIAPSRYLAGVLRGWGVSESRIRVIYNGVDLPSQKQEVKSKKYPHRIMAAARLVPWKNLDVLIKAMASVLQRVPDATLTIAGDGPELVRLRALADAPMLRGKVEFVGRLKREDLLHAISESAVFALPSAYEGFSHQLVEAFACGSAVVASRAGGNTELVEDGKNGLLVEPGDVAGLAKALLRFLEDPAFATACGQEAMKDLSRFTTETQISETTEAVLGRAGVRVALVSRDPSAADPDSPAAARMRAYASRLDGLEVVALGRAPSSPRHDARGYHARVVDARRGILSLAAFVRATIAAAKDAGATLIVAQDPFEAGLAAHVAAYALRLPYLVEDHGAFFADDVWRSETALNRLRARVGLHIVRRAQGLRVVSLRGAEAYKRLKVHAPIELAPVAMRLADSRIELKTGGPFTLLYAGRFSAEKDLPALLEAFARLKREVPDASLLLAGSGPEESRLREAAAALGLGEAVRFLPWTDDIGSIFAQADVAVLPSRREGYGRFAAEALSYGVPVVMTDVGLAREVVRNGVEGLVVPVRRPDLLAAALIKLAKEPQLRHLLAAAARRRAASLPKQDEVADRVTGFWKRIAGV